MNEKVVLMAPNHSLPRKKIFYNRLDTLVSEYLFKIRLILAFTSIRKSFDFSHKKGMSPMMIMIPLK